MANKNACFLINCKLLVMCNTENKHFHWLVTNMPQSSSLKENSPSQTDRGNLLVFGNDQSKQSKNKVKILKCLLEDMEYSLDSLKQRSPKSWSFWESFTASIIIQAGNLSNQLTSISGTVQQFWQRLYCAVILFFYGSLLWEYIITALYFSIYLHWHDEPNFKSLNIFTSFICT